MKPLKYRLLIAVIVFFSLLPLRATAQDDVRFIGEIYYELHTGTSAAEIKPLQVMCIGDQCLLTGDDETGTAFVRDNTLTVTLYGSRVSGDMGGMGFSPDFRSLFYVRYMELAVRSMEGICTEMSFQTAREQETVTDRFPVRIIVPGPPRANARNDIRTVGELYFEFYDSYGGYLLLRERKPMQVISIKGQYFLFGSGEVGTAFIQGDAFIITLYGSEISGGTKESPDIAPDFRSRFYIRYMEVNIRGEEGTYNTLSYTEMNYQTKPEPYIYGGGDYVLIRLSEPFFPFSAAAQDDFRFIGEIHYELRYGVSDSETKPIQVICFGDRHCLLSGSGETGSAFINGDTLTITLYGAHGSATRYESVFYIRNMEVAIPSLEGVCTEMYLQQTKPEQPTITTNRFPVRIILPNP